MGICDYFRGNSVKMNIVKETAVAVDRLTCSLRQQQQQHNHVVDVEKTQK